MLVDSFLHFCSVVLVLTFRQRQGTHQKVQLPSHMQGENDTLDFENTHFF